VPCEILHGRQQVVAIQFHLPKRLLLKCAEARFQERRDIRAVMPERAAPTHARRPRGHE